MHLHPWRGSLHAHTCLFTETRVTCADHPRVEYASHQGEQTQGQALPHATTGCQREMDVCVSDPTQLPLGLVAMLDHLPLTPLCAK
jgi:hypothetical protein